MCTYCYAVKKISWNIISVQVLLIINRRNYMAELSVSRKSVGELLSLGDINSKGKKFIIPDYQRPYKWDKEKCETLWIDLTNFYSEASGNDDRAYFLGTIVTCMDGDNAKEINIIDGQQRITSLFLLLRAFYTKLEDMMENMPDDDEVQGLMSSIEPCIWNINKMSKKVTDRTDLHINSLVATVDDNIVFHKILETGEESESNSFYAINYSFFLNKCNEFAKDNPMNDKWKELCLCILEKCIVLPIECEDLDSALTIFGTLNDRGLPLSDSDIFKAELYKLKKSKEEKAEFTKDWKALTETVGDGGFTLDDLFRYYTHIIRANKKDRSKEIGLRRFYAGKDTKYVYFKEDNFFDNITELAEFWKALNDMADQEYSTLEARKYIHCLSCYPNEYWKYPVSVFYFKHKGDDDFKNIFTVFLGQLMSYLLVSFVVKPTVNAIKDPIYKFCVDLWHEDRVNFDFTLPVEFESTLSTHSSLKISRSMILLHSYLHDENQAIIEKSFEIEHIFPKKWQDTNYNGWNKEDAEIHLDMFGNKIALEKKLNIQAGNGYFGQKKVRYGESGILEIKSLAIYDSDDWVKEDIEKRNENMFKKLKAFFENNLTTPSSIADAGNE